MFHQVAIAGKFGQVCFDGGSLCACLLLGLQGGESAVFSGQGYQVSGEFGQALGEHFFSLNLLTKAFDLGRQR